MTSPVNYTDPTGHVALINSEEDYYWALYYDDFDYPEWGKKKDSGTDTSTGSGTSSGSDDDRTVAGEIVNAVTGGQLDRVEAQIEDPSFYNVMNNWTWGFWETADRALFNENPGSLDHWLNSISFALTVVGMYKLGTMIASSLSSNTATTTINSVANTACNANDLNHIFGRTKHNLNGFLSSYGNDQSSAYNALQNAIQNHVDANGISGLYKEVINVGGFEITVKGKVIDGVARIATAFIP